MVDFFKQLLPKATLFFVLILPAIIVQFAPQSKELDTFTHLAATYLPLYIVVLLIAKTLGVIYPPLPGGIFTLASIPFIGWQWAYTIDIIGSTIGATIAYYLGKKYGFSILNRLVGTRITEKIASIKLRERNQVEAAMFLRFASGGTLSDGLAWGAYLIGFRYMPFIVGYGISHVITTLPIFYFVGAAISMQSWVIFATAAVLAWLVIYKFKGRYFE